MPNPTEKTYGGLNVAVSSLQTEQTFDVISMNQPPGDHNKRDWRHGLHDCRLD
jgi:hypothetical protein